MEIILAFFLFFGGFTLGTISAEESSDAPLSTKVVPDTTPATDTSQITKAIHQNELAPCHTASTPIYKDLTRPTLSNIDQRAIESADWKAECSDE